jgi:hypothetical protein
MMTKRFRLRFTFWLDIRKAAEEELADQIELLKNRRAFSGTVRDGIRLIIDLRAGNLDVLLELFPWISAELKGRAGGDDDTPDRIARIEAMLLQQQIGGDNGLLNKAQAAMSGPKPLSIDPRPPVAPIDDEDDGDLLVITAAASGGESASNFLDSAFGLQG